MAYRFVGLLPRVALAQTSATSAFGNTGCNPINYLGNTGCNPINYLGNTGCNRINYLVLW